MKLLSVVIPVYNEAGCLRLLYDRLVNLPDEKLCLDYEFVFVDDGSTDGSLGVLEELAQTDPRVKVISFSRNFGSHAAILAGLKHASGDAGVCIGADLEDPPEIIPELAKSWQRGAQVVWGYRQSTGGGVVAKFCSRMYARLMSRLAFKNWPTSNFDVVLVDRKVLDAVRDTSEHNVSIFGLLLWPGFSQSGVAYRKSKRGSGKSKWTLAGKVKLFVDSVVSFSCFPLRLSWYLGILSLLVGLALAIVMVVQMVWHPELLKGWTLVILVVLLVAGVQMLMLGIIGEYLCRTLDEAKGRAQYVIARKIGFQPKSEA